MTNATQTIAQKSDLGLSGILLRFGSKERSQFLQLFWTYGIAFTVLFCGSWFVLYSHLSFRFDRADAFLLKKGLVKMKTGETELAFGRRLYWLAKAVQAALLSPFLILLVWGSEAATRIIKAPMMGVSMLTVWVGFIVGAYGFCLWKKNGWSFTIRGSSLLLKTLLTLPTVLFLLFELLAAVGDKTFSFTGISWAFMTLNIIPIMALALANDPSLRLTQQEWLANRHLQLGQNKTAMATTEVDQISQDAQCIPAVTAKRAAHDFGIFNKLCYGFSVGTLFMYIIIFMLGSGKGGDGMAPVAICVVAAILFLDFIVYLLWRGDHVVNPFYIFLVVLLIRGCLISFGHRYWFLGMSTMYLVFGMVITKTIVDHMIAKKIEKNERKAITAAIEATDTKNEHPEQESPFPVKKVTLRSLANHFEGKSVLIDRLTQPFFIFAFITFGFCVALAYMVVFGSSNMWTVTLLSNPHHQWEFGVASLYIVIVLPLFYFAFRNSRVEALLDTNAHDELNFGKSSMSVMALFYVVTVVGGNCLFLITKAHEILFTSICVPIMIISFLLWNVRYRAMDFQALGPRSHRLHPTQIGEERDDIYWDEKFKLGCCGGWTSGVPILVEGGGRNWWKGDFRLSNALVAYFRGGLPRSDYIMIGYAQAFIFTTIFWGASILYFETSKDEYVRGIGGTVTIATFLLVATVLPIVEWFNRLEVSNFMVSCIAVAIFMHIGIHMYVWRIMQGGAISFQSMGTLFSFVLYPAIVFMSVAIYKWKDDRHKLSPFVLWSFGASQISIFCFEVCVTVFYSLISGIIMMVIHSVVLFSGASVFMWVKNKYYLSKKQKQVIVGVFGTVVLLGALLSVSGRGMNAYYAFTASWFILFFFFAGAATVSLYGPLKERTILFSDTVFPVYVWDPSSDKVKVSYNGILFVYLALFCMLFWGVVTTIFISPVYVGVGFASISITLIACITMTLSSVSHQIFAHAVLTIRQQDEFENIMRGEQNDSLSRVLDEAKEKALKSIESAPHISSYTSAASTPRGHIPDLEAQVAVKLPSASDYSKDVQALEASFSVLYQKRVEFSCSNQRSAKVQAEPAVEKLEIGGNNASTAACELLKKDRLLARAFREDLSISCFYRALVQLSAATRLQQSEAAFASFLDWCRNNKIQGRLLDMGVQKDFGRDAQDLQAKGAQRGVTLPIVFSWATSNKKKFLAFQELSKEFRVDKEKKRIEEKQKEEIERIANERREQLRKQAEEERKKKEAERWRAENAEAARKMEEEQRRAEEEIRKRLEEERQKVEEEEAQKRAEEERQIAEIGLINSERIRLEQERKLAAEAERRRQQEEDERAAEEQRISREKRLKELEERRRKRNEEIRRKDPRERKRLENEEEKRREEEEKRMDEEREKEERQKQKELEEARRKREEEQRRKELEDIRKRAEAGGGGGGSGGGGGNDDRKSEAERLREKKRAEIARRRAEREAKRGNADAQREQRMQEAIEQKRLETISAQAEAAIGTEGMSEEDVLKRDFELDQEGKYIDKAWKDPKHATRIYPAKEPEDRIEADGMQWVRPEKLMQAPVMGNFSADDIHQGSLGDCWLLAAMTVIALHPEYLEKIMDPEGNKRRGQKGYYSIKLFSDGEYKPVLIDSNILSTRTNNQERPYKPMYVTGGDENELWPMLLEKAYARFHGSFEAINGGFVDVGLVDFTGGFGGQIDFKESRIEINSGALFKRLLEYHNSGFLMGAGSPSGTDTETSDSGIVQGHAYAILDIVEDSDGKGKHQLVCMRNPWGESEWNGAWSDNDKKNWSTRMKKRCQFTRADDGKFWISFRDFTRHFARVYLCKTFKLASEGGQFFYSKGTAKWSIEDGTAKGAPQGRNTGAHKNPHFLIKPSRPCSVYISVEQRALTSHMATRHHQNIRILKIGGLRCGKIFRGDTVVDSGAYTPMSMVTLECKLEPYEPGYTLMLSTYNPNCEANITVRVYSDAPLEGLDYSGDAPPLPIIPHDVAVNGAKKNQRRR